MTGEQKHRRGLFFFAGFVTAAVVLFAASVVMTALRIGSDTAEFFNARGRVADRVTQLLEAEPATTWSRETIVHEHQRDFTVYVRPTGDQSSQTPILISWPPEHNRSIGPYVVVGYANGSVRDIETPDEWNELFRALTAPPTTASTEGQPSPGGTP